MAVETLPLTEELVAQYHRDGFLLASGLVSEVIARKGEDAMWDVMEMDRDDGETWDKFPDESRTSTVQAGFTPRSGLFQYFGNQNPDLLACYTPEMMAAMAQLTGEPVDFFQPPTGTLVQNVFPTEGEWEWRGVHFDGAVKDKMHKTFPGPFIINSLIYLNDIEKHGGGTVGWPGSHKPVRELAESDPEKYEYMWQLKEDLHTVDVGDYVELEPKCGDILFFAHFCVHAASKNVRETPRLALRSRW
ncbi:MAG: phytanoyl-CoA dioxygenase family protein [Candidatus Latescibacteria bacterium]|jgi:hypothetical protein|nr:phytanoyl-CoA dioxygenase family protein [Candidatus Latescibacterota bacterium]